MQSSSPCARPRRDQVLGLPSGANNPPAFRFGSGARTLLQMHSFYGFGGFGFGSGRVHANPNVSVLPKLVL